MLGLKKCLLISNLAFVWSFLLLRGTLLLFFPAWPYVFKFVHLYDEIINTACAHACARTHTHLCMQVDRSSASEPLHHWLQVHSLLLLPRQEILNQLTRTASVKNLTVFFIKFNDCYSLQPLVSLLNCTVAPSGQSLLPVEWLFHKIDDLYTCCFHLSIVALWWRNKLASPVHACGWHQCIVRFMYNCTYKYGP